MNPEPGEPVAPESLVSPPPVVEPPAERKIWPSVVTLVLAFLGLLVGSCFIGVLFASMWDPSKPFNPQQLMADPLFLVAILAVTQLSLFLCVRYLPRLLRDEQEGTWRARVRWDPQRVSGLDVLVTTLGCLAAGTAVLAMTRMFALEGTALQAIKAAARASDSGLFAFMVLFGTLGAGFTEELAFRGLLQTRLVEKLGPAVGIVLSAAAFGLWHFDVVHSTFAMAIGLWLGWCAHRQKTIVTVMLAHTLNNLISFIGSRARAEDAERVIPDVFALVGGLLVLALCAVVMHVRHRTPATSV